MLENVSVDWQVADYIPTGNWQISLAHSPLPDAPTYLQLLHHSALHKISTPLPTFISWTSRWMSLNSPRLFCHPLLWLGLLQRQLGPVGSLQAPPSTFPAAGLRPLLPPLHLSTSLHPASLLYCPPSTCHPPAPPPSICPPPSPSLSHPSAAPLLNFAYLLLHNRISEPENKMKRGEYILLKESFVGEKKMSTWNGGGGGVGTVEERSGELSLSLSLSPSCSEEAPVPGAPEELSFTHSLWKLTCQYQSTN